LKQANRSTECREDKNTALLQNSAIQHGGTGDHQVHGLFVVPDWDMDYVDFQKEIAKSIRAKTQVYREFGIEDQAG
jgi:hypothetical protein